MKDKLYQYLKAKGGSASSVAIVGQLLNIRGARRDLAEKIVRSWVQDNSLFVSDGLGNWYINPEGERKGTPLSEVNFNLVEIRGNTTDLFKSSFLEIGICQVQNGKIIGISMSSAFRAKDNDPSKFHMTDESKSMEDVLTDILPRLEDGVLTSFDVPKVRNFLRSEVARCLGESTAFWELSLRGLSRRLFPKQKIKSPSDLARVLNMPFLETEELRAHLSNLSNLFFALSERLKELGLNSLEEVLEFQLPKRKQISFENKKISPHYLANLPEAPGVYLIMDRRGEIVYVGKARNLKRRVGSYFYARESLDEKLLRIWDEMFDFKTIELGSELEAFLEEQKLIRKYKPKLNSQMEVHVKSDVDSPNRSLVIMLPSKRAGYVNLFCTNSSGKSAALAVSQKRDISNNVKEQLRRLFFSSKVRKVNHEEMAQTEIILRWFEQNRDKIHWIDMNQIVDLKDCLRLIEQYKNVERQINERVIYR